MSQLERVFNYRGKGVRVVFKNGEPLFVAADVCRILEIGNSRDAAARLDDDEKGVVLTDTPGGPQEMTAVNEPGLYHLILSSRKPEARAFKRWVTHEVLPSIRRTGSYHRIPQTYPEALRLAADLAEENQKLRPKAEAHDLFMDGKNAQSMGVVAKSLNMGRNRLFGMLRDKKILMANNVPYQEFIERGYFRVIEKSIVMGDQTINKPQTLVTAKGVDWIGRLLKGAAS